MFLISNLLFLISLKGLLRRKIKQRRKSIIVRHTTIYTSRREEYSSLRPTCPYIYTPKCLAQPLSYHYISHY